MRVRTFDTDLAEGQSASTRYTHRLSPAGVPVGGFGTNGILQESAGSYTVESITYYTDRDIRVMGTAVTSDGGLIRLVRTSEVSDYGNSRHSSVSIVLERRNAAGLATASTDLTGVLRPERKDSGGGMADATIQLDADGSWVYLLSDGRLLRASAQTLTPDAAYNGGSGTADLGASFSSSRFAIDTLGRLLLIADVSRADGTASGLNLRVFKGTTAGFGTAAGSVTLLPGGLLDVAGTTKDDTVRLRRVKTKLQVEINGKIKRFAFSDVTGVLIHTGAGKDVINPYDALMSIGVNIQAGTGNDRITGTPRNDTIDAGTGNDSVDGSFGSDFIYGQAGRDTLMGGQDADYLYGGADADTLWANDPTGIDDGVDNYLFGGGSKDVFVASTHPYANYNNRDRIQE